MYEQFFHPVRLRMMPGLTDEEIAMRSYNLKQRIPNATILENESIIINGIHFFGAKWYPEIFLVF